MSLFFLVFGLGFDVKECILPVYMFSVFTDREGGRGGRAEAREGAREGGEEEAAHTKSEGAQCTVIQLYFNASPRARTTLSLSRSRALSLEE